MPAPTYKLIAGLGNPGAAYLFTRHNVGFMVLDVWADEEGAPFKDESARQSKVATLATGERLVKPMTYMNESGRAVVSWLEWLKLAVSDLLVVVDDYFQTSTINYHGGDRYPHLVRDEAKPDYLDELIKAHAATK